MKTKKRSIHIWKRLIVTASVIAVCIAVTLRLATKRQGNPKSVMLSRKYRKPDRLRAFYLAITGIGRRDSNGQLPGSW